jgi:sterol 3beta-glucosyltransferase
VVFAQATCYGSWIAEALKLPSVSAYYLPLTRTRFMPSFVFPPLPSRLGGLRERYNLLTFDVGGFLVWAPMQGIANKVRDRHFHLPPIPLGQPPWRSFPPGHPYLYGFSSAVVPRPPDWDEHKYVTGYWFLDRLPDWRPPAELVDFLDSGPPPVCVTFGSMVNTDAEEVTAGIVQALTRAGQRGLLLTGAGGLTSSFLTDDIRAFQEVPHDWLFPRVAAAVHHGGAGTSGAALRAGIPSVVVPFLGDQPFWARRLFNLGASPRPIRRKRLSPERLEAAVRVAVTDPAMRKRAARLGEQIRAEDGVGQAVAVFHRYLGLPYEPPTPAEQGRREVLTAS